MPPGTGTAESSALLRVFAYGTLREGFASQAHYCRGATSAQAAAVWGLLYRWAPGVPVLRVPASSVLRTGTGNYAGDALQGDVGVAQSGWTAPPREGEPWREIRGDLVTFPDAAERLRLLDAVEGVRPRTPRAYARVLLPARLLDPPPGQPALVAAWTYVFPLGTEPPGAALGVDSWHDAER
jgi:gamma-glutamylcyclotransferase (GGCT)/AIG2-like uncharacterized protein YtfP